ncbi:ATP-binding protein [Microcella daejeonensis]|uniref:ATP-binding protein n=1 Tax=Microcella daejeonensis TaxID=2994971 RepID=UPI0022709865|nr:ATP-binding protein [Microcella daejeonensis]WAB83779.1 ATP-binding protein [Microcella daejeonensis]
MTDSPTARLGSAVDNPASDVLLELRRLNRHTFWCGQSGSGKTYALGVLLERVLISTALPMVIFDPNGDFVRLGRGRDDAPEAARAALGRQRVTVLSPSPSGDAPMHLRFGELEPATKAAVMQLDPIRDAEEYNALQRLVLDGPPADQDALLAFIADTDDPGRRRLGRRIENLGIPGWAVWAWGGPSILPIIDEEHDATVLDLGGFADSEEYRVAALAVLDHLWAHRASRRPRLLVIDEAHNLAAPGGDTPLARLLTDRIAQIAAEGRKFGLWMIVSTQRPSKVHPNIVSQCDNLTLMRMSSRSDLDELGSIFGFAPTALVERSPDFLQGQALMAGPFVGGARVVQMAARWTEEAGSDVAVPLVASSADGT